MLPFMLYPLVKFHGMDMTVVCMDTDQVFHEEYRVLKMVVKHQAASRALLVPVAESEANTSISIPTHGKCVFIKHGCLDVTRSFSDPVS